MVKKICLFTFIILLSLLNFKYSYCQNYPDLGIKIPENQNFQFVEKYKEGSEMVHVFQAVERKGEVIVRKKITISVYDSELEKKYKILRVMRQNFESKGLTTRIEEPNSNNPKLFVEGNLNVGTISNNNIKVYMRLSASGNKAYTILAGFKGVNNNEKSAELFSKFVESIHIY